MRKLKLRGILPIHSFVLISYCVLVLYAYANTNRRVNNLVVLLTILLVIDGIYFFICMKQIEVTLMGDKVIQKGETFNFNVRVYNKGMLPIPYIELVPADGKRVHIEQNKHIVMMLKRNERVIQPISYRADLCGLEEMSLDKVIYKSLFSFFRKEVTVENKVSIKILPEIRYIENVQLFTEFIGRHQIEDRQNRQSYLQPQEEVGYELKPYVFGDSQKLIHWKIAAYKDEWLVRQREDESEKREDIFFILAPFLSAKYGEKMIQQDKVLTTFVSLVSYYLEKMQKVRVAFYHHNLWHYIKIKNVSQLRSLQERLASYESLLVEQNINQRSIIKGIIELAEQKEGTKIIVSGYWTKELETYILSSGVTSNVPYLWTGISQDKERLKKSILPIWYMTDEYQLMPLHDIEEM